MAGYIGAKSSGIISGIDASIAELNLTDKAAANGVTEANKVLTADANKDVTAIRNLAATGAVAAGGVITAGGAITATGASVGALARGAIQTGNASGVAAPLSKGAAGTVLTAGANDLSWAVGGTPFAGGYLAVTGDVTLTAGQSGYQIYVTGERLLALPAIAQDVYYIIKNGGTNNVYIKPNGSQTINGFATAVRIYINAGSDIIIINDGSSNWRTITNTVGATLAEATTITTSQTFTPKTITTSILVCVSGSSCGANSPVNTQNQMSSAGAGGPGYAEKFFSSPASSYVCSIGTFGDVSGNAGSNTTAAGMTCPPSAHFAARYTTSNGTTVFAGGAAGSGGTFSAAGGAGAAKNASTRYGGGGGAGTRAGAGGNAGANASGSHSYYFGGTSGGTGGNNGDANETGQVSEGHNGAAATAKASGSYVVSGITSETYMPGGGPAGSGIPLGGAGAQTIMNWNGGTFTIAPGRQTGGTRGLRPNAHDVGENNGAFGGLGGTVTFVEFF